MSLSAIRRKRFTSGKQEEDKLIKFTALTEGAQISVSIPIHLTPSDFKHLDYSLDNGETWVVTDNVYNQGFNITVPALHIGHSVLFKGEGLTMAASASAGYNCQFTIRNGQFNCSGNILSLLFGEDADEQDIPADYAFYRLFRYCSGLKSVPRLPSKVLKDWCYASMFESCTDIVESPLLPALDLSRNSYQYNTMFDGCTNLRKITMLATSVYYNSLSNWVRGVAATGVFVKNPAMTTLPTGNNGIPSGWTVEDYVG